MGGGEVWVEDEGMNPMHSTESQSFHVENLNLDE